MGNFFRDYGTPFAYAIAAVTTIISLVSGQFFKDNSRVGLILLSVSVVVFIFGIATSFYAEHQKVLRDRAKNEEAVAEVNRRILMKERLGVAIRKCSEMSNRNKQRVDSDDDAKAYESDLNAWCFQTSKVIEKAYGKGEVVRFWTAVGTTKYGATSSKINTIHTQMLARLERLSELIARADTIVMVGLMNTR
jgi:hypothetical protein